MKVKLAHLGVGKGGQSSPNVFVEDRRQQAALSLSLSLLRALTFYLFMDGLITEKIAG